MKRVMIAELTRLAKEAGPDILPEDVLLSRVAGGELLREIAESIGRTIGQYISPATLSAWINRTPELKRRLAEARKDAASLLAEEAVGILDSADEDRDALAKAKSQADIRTWLASKWDRQTFGNDAAQVNVSVSMGDYHLDALRHRTLPTVQVQPALPAGPDYEVVPD